MRGGAGTRRSGRVILVVVVLVVVVVVVGDTGKWPCLYHGGGGRGAVERGGGERASERARERERECVCVMMLVMARARILASSCGPRGVWGE